MNNDSVLQDLGFGVNKQGETWERVTQIRDKFEYDRERRMRERGKLMFVCTRTFSFMMFVFKVIDIKLNERYEAFAPCQ